MSAILALLVAIAVTLATSKDFAQFSARAETKVYVVLLSLLVLLTILAGVMRAESFSIRYYLKSKARARAEIAVLTGLTTGDPKEQPPEYTWTEYKHEDWIEALSEVPEFNIRSISTSQISEPKYAVIVNPFGEVYPEENRANLKTLNAIADYIHDGGIFVNVAGIPFCYLWDTRDKVRDFPTGPVRGYHAIAKDLMVPTSFLDIPEVQSPWIRQTFGILTTLDFEGRPGSSVVPACPVEDPYYRDLPGVCMGQVREFRSSIRCLENKATLVPLVKSRIPAEQTKNQFIPCFPMAAIRFGYGYLIHVGLDLRRDRHQDFELVIAAVRACVCKLRNEGTL